MSGPDLRVKANPDRLAQQLRREGPRSTSMSVWTQPFKVSLRARLLPQRAHRHRRTIREAGPEGLCSCPILDRGPGEYGR